jgi:hypothetical protein
MLVEGGVEVYEIGEEPACGNFACEFVEVVIGVFRQVAHASLFLPYLYREDCGGAVAHTFVCAVQ